MSDLCFANTLRAVAEKINAEQIFPSMLLIIATSPITFVSSPLLYKMSNFVSFCCCQAELSIVLIFLLLTFTLNSLTLFFTILDFSRVLSACYFMVHFSIGVLLS